MKVLFHPVYSVLLSCSEDHTIKVRLVCFDLVDYAVNNLQVWDLETGQIEKSFKAHLSTILDLCFDSTGARFGERLSHFNQQLFICLISASCSADSSIKVWDFGDSYECLRTLRGHSHTVSSIAFLPNS